LKEAIGIVIKYDRISNLSTDEGTKLKVESLRADPDRQRGSDLPGVVVPVRMLVVRT
jgi:hypothetical protein